MDDIRDDADLQWLAFAYVADELSAADRRGFEARLESDQAAREAVASALELAQGVSAAFALPTPQRPWSKVARPLAWSGLGAAAALVVAVSVHFAVVGKAKPDLAVAGVASVDQQVLTSAWTEVRGAARDADAESFEDWFGVEVDEPAAPAEERSSPPGWLLLATSTTAARSQQ